MENQQQYLVAIKCITYNHEKYLADALEGFVMQKTNFPFVAIVHDDASTDGTAEILRQYAEKYPDIIHPIYETENQYSKRDGSLGRIMNEAIAATGAKYIAMCEGDDYWTDPYKLQKQVDFMEANLEYSVCFHRYNIVRQEEQEWRADACGVYLQCAQEGVDLTIDMYLRNWVTQPLTIVYRKDAIDEIAIYHLYKHYKDQHLIYHLLRAGKGHILNFVGGVYREHCGGIHSKTSLKSQCDIALAVAKELYDVNGTKELKENLLRTYDWVISQYTKNRFDNRWCLHCIYERFKYSKSFKKYIRAMRRFLWPFRDYIFGDL